MNLGSLPVLDRLAGCERILLVGAGGGYDIMAGVPLFTHLRARGQQVFLGSLSFADLSKVAGRKLASSDWLEVGPGTGGDEGYFPERYLSEWFLARGDDVKVYCFSPTGTMNLKLMYDSLLKKLPVDALVLVDGGTDSLMRGDEPGLGTPAEDMPHIACAHMLDVPVKLLVNLGFGVDTHHGVCHAHVLEAVADLTRENGFLGAFSLLPGMPEFQAFAEAVAHVCQRMPGHESIVATSVVAAGEGRFGDYHPTPRTEGTELFINPLMAMYWGFELDAVARRCLYLDYLKDTYSRWDVNRALSNYLYTVKPREWQTIPL